MTEKRQFFRIQQDVIFNFKCVNTDSVTHISPEQHFDHASALGLFSQFQQLDNDSHATLEHIRKENLPVADYLEMLNQKMNLLSQQMLANEAVSVNDTDSGRIDLSQGGIGFTTSHPIGIESWLALKLVFLPSYIGLLTYAQVTRNQLQEDGSYLIGARFHQLNEEQERILSRQVIQTQLVEKRQQKSQVHH
ncbi:MAG: PilZ domain-containing protein [Cellvibrionaceae bacterium]